ncbi:helix-turn-helix domain-containing protein [Limosilactobacillus caviae]|uniref:helix-turn-helix domain-containing protein n=1 Tax=Limosilactobacillus caviae TaxID=1769424 RepID=UPI0035132D2B
MPVENELEKATANVEKQIKIRLLERDMTQTELASLIGENPQQVNRAIKGNSAPRSVEIRKKIYRVLDM